LAGQWNCRCRWVEKKKTNFRLFYLEFRPATDGWPEPTAATLTYAWLHGQLGTSGEQGSTMLHICVRPRAHWAAGFAALVSIVLLPLFAKANRHWAEVPEDEERLIWGEWPLVEAWRFNCRQLNLTTGSS